MKTVMKMAMIISGVVVMASPVQAVRKNSVDVFNDNLNECFAMTETDEPTSKRACNAVIRSSLATRGNVAVAYHNRGVINLKLGNTDNALADFRAAITRKPDLAMSHIAIAQLEKGDGPELAKQ
jgi:tetratricopeptide (TPR) repeat protein